MTASELKAKVIEANPDTHFFDRQTMKFFGDTMTNYGVRQVVIDTWTETGVDCWELYRKHPVKNGLRSSAYFRRATFKQASNRNA